VRGQPNRRAAPPPARPDQAVAVAGLGAVAAARGDTVRAGRLWGVVERLEEEMGVRLHGAERVRYERLISSVEGDPAFTAAVSAGRRLTLERAVADAAAGE
jgi:hypothetical protein